MAYEGQVVKLENGRWARFQHLDLAGMTSARWDGAILVAVELEERYQSMLEAAQGSLDELYERGVPMQLTLTPNEMGEMSARWEESAVH